ncbi:MAG: OmpA family protein [Cyclobacteriaceae bacterium]
MKKFFVYTSALVLCCSLFGIVNAQTGLLRYADQRFEETNYFEAAQGFEKAFEKKATYRAAKGAALSYAYLRDYQKTHEWWKKAVQFPEADNHDLLQFIGASNQVGNKDEVLKALDSLGNGALEKLDNLNLDSLKSWYGQDNNAKMKGLEDINTTSTEYGWVLDAQGNAYFTSDRGGENDRDKKALRIDKSYKYYNKESDWTGRDFLGIYKMDKDGQIMPLEVPVPDVFHVTDPAIAVEKGVLFYTVTREIRRSKNYAVQPEIYYSSMSADGKLLDFKGLSINNPLEYGLKSPFLDEENQKLYFSSDMPGGFGGYDLYYMDYSGDFEFGKPVNMGAVINTSGNERDPFLNEDVFYFASDGHIGLGGLDVFMSDLKDNVPLGVKNMGLPFNSPQDDFSVNFSGDGKLLISSNRPGSRGWDDLFEMEELFKKFQALVLNCDGDPVSGELDVALMVSTESKQIAVDLNGDGGIQAELAPDTGYEILIKKDGFFSVHDKNLTTVGLTGDQLEKSYQLIRIPYKTAVYVDLIYYNLDESAIREDAEASLNKVAELLKTYSFLNVSVASHTDARASDEYNQALSEKRANTVRDYLSKFGLPGSRVNAVWHGEEELANDCGDGVPCPDALHQINRRTELMLLAFPEQGKAYEMPPDFLGQELCDINNIQIPSNMPAIYFGFDRADISAAERMALEKVAFMLKSMVNQRLVVTGHTDNRGPDDYNSELSKKRALVVKEYLEGRGIASDRIVYEFFGKNKPINDCGEISCTPEMHRINRRTELSLKELNNNWSKGQ